MTVTAEYAIELGRQLDELELESEELRAEIRRLQARLAAINNVLAHRLPDMISKLRARVNTRKD